MPFSFQIKKPKDLTQLLAQLKDEAAKHNIAFTGDETWGHASGYGFAGEYIVHSNSIELIVHKKPFIVSNAKIQQEIEKFLAQIETAAEDK